MNGPAVYSVLVPGVLKFMELGWDNEKCCQRLLELKDVNNNLLCNAEYAQNTVEYCRKKFERKKK